MFLGSLSVREYVDQFEDLYGFFSGILPSKEAKCDRFSQGLHVGIRSSMTWFRGSNFYELVEVAINVEKVRQEEKEYEKKMSRKHGQSSSQRFRDKPTKRGYSSSQSRTDYGGSSNRTIAYSISSYSGFNGTVSGFFL